MTNRDIVTRARHFINHKYWYGAKGELASVALANRLRKENPGTWTDIYYAKALQDVDNHTCVCDCSGLVCYAYNIGTISSWGLNRKYSTYTGAPKAGMIAWKSGHVGVFAGDGWNAPIIEMAGIDSDYKAIRTFKDAGFKKVLFDPDIDYEEGVMVDDSRAVGWHADNFGWWYRYHENEGCYYRECFVRVGAHWYYFDADGYIVEPKGAKLYRVAPDSEEGWIV